MVRENDKSDLQNLPSCAVEFIKQVLKKMRYRRKVRREVQEELTAHFEDELKDCETDEDKEQKARQLIAEFGDVKLLAVLLRRAKKRCRPLWRTAVVRSFQGLGIIILYFIICSLPLLVGRPTISVNYIDWLNELVKSERNEADNARPYYEKAIKLYVKNPQDWLHDSGKVWSSDLNDVEISILSDWLEDNQGALEALREGSLRTDFWNEYQSNQNQAELNKSQLKGALMASNLMANTMEILPSYRHLAFAMRWQIRYEANNGDIETALSDCVTLTKFGGHLQGHGLLIEQLVGIAIEGLANSTTFMLLDRIDVPADVLKNAQEELEKQFGRQVPVISMEAEKVFWYDQIQRTFTDNGQGGGRMLVRGMGYVVTDDWKENLWRFVSFDYPDRQEVVANIDKYFGRFAEILTETPWELRDETKDDQLWNEVNITLMLKIQIPALVRVGQIAWRMKSGREALLTVLAVMRYEKEKGRYPAGLDELVEAGYLKKLPMDPYSDGPLVYRRTESGFLLYSLGTNLTDEGGKLGLRGGRPKMWAHDGDWVFWPVAKPQVK
ncbi:MAG: hypothetical protein HQ580_02105 [Planctomycetes bacterium]|nr:hypothetical protein [Planctomycetota bacterium]